MSTEIEKRLAHSADVRMHLRLDGRIFTISQMTPTYVIVDDTIDHPAAEAELVLSVDGRTTRWPAFLQDGMSRSAHRVSIVRRP
jgi:hypothetical protein